MLNRCLTQAVLDGEPASAFQLHIATTDLSALSKFLRILPDHRFSDRAPVPPAAPSYDPETQIGGLWNGTRWRGCLQGVGSRECRLPGRRRLPGQDDCPGRTAPPVADAVLSPGCRLAVRDRQRSRVSWPGPPGVSVGDARHSGRGLLSAAPRQPGITQAQAADLRPR